MRPNNKLQIILALSIFFNLINAYAFYSPGAYRDNQGRSYTRLDGSYNFFNTPTAITTLSSLESGSSFYAANKKVSNQAGISAGFGYKPSEAIRTDITLTYRPAIAFQLANDEPGVARSSVANYTVMANGYYAFNLNVPFEVYGMGGIGVSTNATKNLYWPVAGVVEGGLTENHFAWQVGAGVSYPVGDSLLIDINYQFVDLGSFTNNGYYDATQSTPTHWGSLYSNQLQIGLRCYI